uniref:Metalloendopeptidase n=1 Tax=Rhabditophanes sp. KR3021 TaxID=114890 RepID=A0AC35TVL7_9BILA
MALIWLYYLRIDSALAEIAVNTCIRYAKQATSIAGTSGINVIKSEGCSSYVGRIYYKRPQIVFISTDCESNGGIQHEFSHALGLEHEHARPDRDRYLNVYTDNIVPDGEDQFSKVDDVNDFGVPFDMGSVMMYENDGFGKNGKKVLSPKQAVFNEDLGQRQRLSFSDFKILNFHYCKGICKTKVSCLNGGYQNPNSCKQCLCPNEFSGPTCSAVKMTTTRCGTIELKATKVI